MKHLYYLALGSLCMLHPHDVCLFDSLRPKTFKLWLYFYNRVHANVHTEYEYRILERLHIMGEYISTIKSKEQRHDAMFIGNCAIPAFKYEQYVFTALNTFSVYLATVHVLPIVQRVFA